MPEPQTHYFQVDMTLENFNEKTLDVRMPVWAPGSYLIREFSKNVEIFDASDGAGNELKSYKTNKNTWRVEKENSDKVVIHYNVYAFEMSVRTSFLDADHGYVNGTSVFMFVDGHLDLPSTLEVSPFEKWNTVSTGLPEDGSKKWTFLADNYDELVDCPIEIGNHKEIKFVAAGIPHTIAMYGEGNYNEDRLKKDLTKIVEELIRIMGENPVKKYVFIIHNLESGGGGLEHRNSATLQVNRWIYSPEKSYDSFLGLAAHEYFHLWLVKRIRPIELGPFDYNQENYTDLLWVMEGFTSYYSQLVLCHLGYLQKHEFLSNLAESFTSLELSPGNDAQPVSMASFDAWIKAYRPNENSSNSQISYYQKGSILAALLDVLIISNSHGEHTLGDVLKYLYETYYLKEQRGFTTDEFKKALEIFAGMSLDSFFSKYINGTEEIDYNHFMELAGFRIKKVLLPRKEINLGITVNPGGGDLMVKSVLKDSPAWKYGINADDEIIAVDGYRVKSSGGIDKILDNREFGDTIEVLVARDGKLKNLSVELQPMEAFYYQISEDKSISKLQEKVFDKWLNN